MPSAAICAPPTPEKRARPCVRCLDGGDQRRAQPVAGFLARHQEDMRRRRCRSPLIAAVRPRRRPTKMPAASAAATKRFRLGDDGFAGRHRDAGKACARRALAPSAGRARADRSGGPGSGLGAFTSTPVPLGVLMRPLGAQFGDARQHLVGAFRRLHRQHVLVRHHHRLADVEGAGGAQIVEAERHVGAVALGRLRRGRARPPAPEFPAPLRARRADESRAARSPGRRSTADDRRRRERRARSAAALSA